MSKILIGLYKTNDNAFPLNPGNAFIILKGLTTKNHYTYLLLTMND